MALNFTRALSDLPDILKRCGVLSPLLDSDDDDASQLVAAYDNTESFFETSDCKDIKMALNVALPLSGLPEFIERCGILSPLPDLEENLQLLVTPYGSSESGIGSSDCDDNKTQTSSSEKDVLTSSLLSSQATSTSTSPVKEQLFHDLKIIHQGRDVLDLANNIMNKNNPWKFQYARLHENNLQMFMNNRSQYHRLGPNGHIREYDLATCNRCTFQFPVNSSIPNILSNDDGATDAIAKLTQSNEKAQMLPSFKMYKHF